MVVCAEPLRDQPRIGQFIELLFPKSNGERLDALRRLRGPRGHDRAGIDPAAEKGADRHVADHMIADRLLEPGTQLFDRFGFGTPVVRAKLQFPIPLDDRLVLRIEA